MLDPLRQTRRLTIALIVSGALNISLLSVFYYWTVKDNPPTPYVELKPANKQEQQLPLAVDLSNSDVIRHLRKMPREQLIARLNNTQLIENGFSLRDLALACLVDFQQFDIEKALLGYPQPLQKRSIIYGKHRDGKPAELVVYPGLSDKQYQAIINFATTERWPMTSKGLFLSLRKQEDKLADPTLSDAFFMSPEFLAVETLFGRSKAPIDKKDLLKVLLQGDWNTLSSFADQQRVSQDLSAARRQRFLLDYVHQKSKAAAQLLLKTDEAIAAHKLDDNQVIQILQLLDEKSPEAEQFALSLLTSPRSDAVWKMAAARLYGYAGEPMPEKYHHHAALSRFVPKSTVMPILAEQISPAAQKNKKNQMSAPPVPSTASAPGNKSKLSIKPVNNPKMAVNNILPPAMRSSPVAQQQPLKRQRLYIVQDGDSLWKISRRFDVDIEAIRSNNKLQSDFLKPGHPLIIP